MGSRSSFALLVILFAVLGALHLSLEIIQAIAPPGSLPGARAEVAARGAGETPVAAEERPTRQVLLPASMPGHDEARRSSREAAGAGGGTGHEATARPAVHVENGSADVAAPAVADPDPVRVHGRVTLEGEGIEGVVLVLRAGDGTLRSGVSGEQGRYEVTVPEPGDYELIASRGGPGRPTRERSVRSLHLQRLRIDDVDALRRDVALPVASIGGRILGPEGEPLAGAAVTVQPDPEFAALSSNASRGYALTAGDGGYELAMLQAGTYLVSVEAPADGGRAARAGVVLYEGQRLAGVDLRIRPTTELRGRVTGVGAAGGARVFAFDHRGHLATPRGQGTSAASTYGLALEPGRVHVLARAGELVSRLVRVDLPESGTEVDLALTPGARLEVVVLNEHGEPVGARVQVLTADDLDLGQLPSEGRVGPGSGGPPYVFGALPAGRYQVRVQNHGHARCEATVVLVAGRAERVVLQLGG